MAHVLHADDVGTVIELEIIDANTQQPVDLTGATVALEFRKPDESLVVRPAIIVPPPTSGRVTYTTEAGFLDRPGSWKVRAVVDETPLRLYRTSQLVFYVRRAP